MPGLVYLQKIVEISDRNGLFQDCLIMSLFKLIPSVSPCPDSIMTFQVSISLPEFSGHSFNFSQDFA